MRSFIKEVRFTDFNKRILCNGTDVGLITVANTEFQEALNILEPFLFDFDSSTVKYIFKMEMPIFGELSYKVNFFFGSIAGINICLTQCNEKGNVGKGTASFFIQYLKKYIDVQFLIMAGVCCGLKGLKKAKNNKKEKADGKEKKLIPIYVSNSITYYESAKIDKNVTKIRSYCDKQSRLLNIFTEEIKVSGATVEEGKYICGEKVVSSDCFKKYVTNLFPDAIALDMESYSMVLASGNTPYIVIKAASDFGFEKKASEGQIEAMKKVMRYIKKCFINAKKRCLIKHIKKRLTIYIGGSLWVDKNDKSDISLFKTSNRAIENLSRTFYDNNFRIINSYGENIGGSLIVSTRKYAYQNQLGLEDLLDLNIFPFDNPLISEHDYNQIEATLRETMISNSDFCVFIYGPKEYNKESGTIKEATLAIEKRKPIIIVPCKGRTILYDTFKDYCLQKYDFPLSPDFYLISKSTPSGITKAINNFVIESLASNE